MQPKYDKIAITTLCQKEKKIINLRHKNFEIGSYFFNLPPSSE
jgi:hypothetical protein